jgi:hypothetical protein
MISDDIRYNPATSTFLFVVDLTLKRSHMHNMFLHFQLTRRVNVGEVSMRETYVFNQSTSHVVKRFREICGNLMIIHLKAQKFSTFR